MAGDLEYTQEMYSNAAQVLGLGEAPARDRLIRAYADHAGHAFPPGLGLGAPMSDQLSERVSALHQRLTRDDAGIEQTPHSRIGAMADDEVEAAIKELLAIAELARRERFPGQEVEERR